LYPFCDEKIVQFSKAVKKVVVVEELDPFIEDHIKQLGIKKRSLNIPRSGRANWVRSVNEVVVGKPKKLKTVRSRPSAAVVCGLPALGQFFGLEKTWSVCGR
jgi:indolepyruvate ferredoxin oxidoreductase alpha subunit